MSERQADPGYVAASAEQREVRLLVEDGSGVRPAADADAVDHLLRQLAALRPGKPPTALLDAEGRG